jgi:polar amino acid transport system substrate-binding protein
MKLLAAVLKAGLGTGLCGLAFGACPASANAACSVVAGYGVEPPYHYPDEDGRVIGIDADILRSVLGDIGCEIRFVQRPWKRTLVEIKEGSLDSTMGASFREERAKFAHYSMPYRGQPHVVITGKARIPAARSLSEFLDNGHNLGVVLGWHYTDAIRALLDGPRYAKQVVTVPKFELAVSMLDAGRFEGLLGNPSVLAGIVGVERVRRDYAMLPADIDVLHILFSRKSVSADIAARFNRQLEAGLEAGLFFDVCGKYESQLLSNCSFLSTR